MIGIQKTATTTIKHNESTNGIYKYERRKKVKSNFNNLPNQNLELKYHRRRWPSAKTPSSTSFSATNLQTKMASAENKKVFYVFSMIVFNRQLFSEVGWEAKHHRLVPFLDRQPPRSRSFHNPLLLDSLMQEYEQNQNWKIFLAKELSRRLLESNLLRFGLH